MNPEINQETPQTPAQAPTLDPMAAPSPTPLATPQPVVPPTAAVVASPKKGMAIASLILSIIGFLTGFIFIGFALALVGLILGIIVLAKHKPGKGLGLAGVIIGGLCLLSLPITLAFTLTAYNGVTNRAIQAQQEAQVQSSN